MKEKTTVVEIHDDEVVLGCITTSCESCAGNSFCNIQGKTFTATNPKGLDLHVGDLVEVNLPPGKTVFSGFMILMVPLLLFLSGLLGIRAFLPEASEGLQALGGFIGLVAGFLIAYIFGRIAKKTYTPTVDSLLR